ncbi:flagellar motor switch phosphatase FliY [Selenomonas sp. oral taxon 149]|uniref:flagellar motor switch phosphatase FliY n=1 Tax=Selenomonas sp. oral taxon 149 TaxID=712535 RepID=UPI0001E0A7F8|nr:flagellar motor switch phosphatase FliY [Selenomonas sp. oral taxon 149]EFM22205.1 flagellar motor switch protein FliN [Selenomonas sp. oral taxon 149 str. 67H29BP]
MSDDMISQEEIDALLSGGGGDDAPADDAAASDDASAAGASPTGDTITDMERDALGEIGNISMGGAATTLSVLLGRKVSITTPTVSISNMRQLKEKYPIPFLVVEVGYSIGIEGNNVLCIQAKDAAIIADLMMGNDGTNPDEELSEIHMSAVSESMNQMMGSVATALSSMFNKKVDITPPVVTLVDLGTEEVVSKLLDKADPIVQASFRMEVDGLIDSEIMQLLPLDVAREMVDALMNQQPDVDDEEEAIAAAAAPPPAAPAAAPASAPAAAAAAPASNGYGAQPMQPHVASNVPVQSAQFTPLSTVPVQVNDANIGLILDVPLQVNVELGRTKKSIKEILDLTKGSIVELDKLAGETVDIMVNGKYLAKGEVVVIDENFGVRITEIVSPLERAARLQ